MGLSLNSILASFIAVASDSRVLTLLVSSLIGTGGFSSKGTSSIETTDETLFSFFNSSRSWDRFDNALSEKRSSLGA